MHMDIFLYLLACFLLAEESFHYIFSPTKESQTHRGQSICRCHVFKGWKVLTSSDTVPMTCLTSWIQSPTSFLFRFFIYQIFLLCLFLFSLFISWK